MGKQAIEIVKMDVKELLKLLNSALASEWLAYYQYWVGALIVAGPERVNVKSELNTHAAEEHAHANLLGNRITLLGGTPMSNPSEWTKLSPCKFDEPSDPYVLSILHQNIAGERCAITSYKKLLDTIGDADPITSEIIKHILAQEEEHEDDLQDLMEDITLLIKK